MGTKIMIHDIIKNRHTTRLMTDSIEDSHVEKILASAKMAPSKNKIHGYKIFALTNSERGKRIKKQLCNQITKYKEQDGSTTYLLQTLAPLVLIYMLDPSPEHQMLGITERTGKEIYSEEEAKITDQRDRYIMIKNSLRDAMISATYAQLTAEGLGLGTAFVACGLEDIIWDREFEDFFNATFGENYRSKSIEPAVIVCIGPKDPKIVELYENNAEKYSEPYLDGQTCFIRSDRERSFTLSDRQKNMIDLI
jgi:nitroreductase